MTISYTGILSVLESGRGAEREREREEHKKETCLFGLWHSRITFVLMYKEKSASCVDFLKDLRELHEIPKLD